MQCERIVYSNTYTRELVHKQYEMSNHLGHCASPDVSPKQWFRDCHPVSYETGVLEVVSDVKIIVQEGRHALEATGEIRDYGDNAWAKFVEIVNSYGTPSELVITLHKENIETAKSSDDGK